MTIGRNAAERNAFCKKTQFLLKACADAFDIFSMQPREVMSSEAEHFVESMMKAVQLRASIREHMEDLIYNKDEVALDEDALEEDGEKTKVEDAPVDEVSLASNIRFSMCTLLTLYHAQNILDDLVTWGGLCLKQNLQKELYTNRTSS